MGTWRNGGERRVNRGAIFLLSPANCSGLRARMVLSERAQFDLAVAPAQRAGRRDRRGVRVRQRALLQGQARLRARVRAAARAGRAARRQRRARDHADRRAAPGRDARSPPTRCARSPGSTSRPTIRATARPLIASARALAEEIGPDCDVVLLGSIASAKYVDVLTAVFGERLRFPDRLRRPRRHEPRRAAAALRAIGRRAALRAGRRRGAPRAAPAEAARRSRASAPISESAASKIPKWRVA